MLAIITNICQNSCPCYNISPDKYNESNFDCKEDFAIKKQARHINTIADYYLRGMGTGCAAVAALKNGVIRFAHENKKDYNADYGNVVIDMLNVSPPIVSTARKVQSSIVHSSVLVTKRNTREIRLQF